MKRKFISILISFLLAQPISCFAVNYNFEDSYSSTNEDNVLLSVINEDGTESNFTANGKLLYFNESLSLIKDKKIKVLEKCTFDASNNEISSALVSVICDSPSTFKAYLSTDKDIDTFNSDNGEINFFVPNNTDFSVDLKSDENINCKLGVLGVGINDVTEESSPMSFKCAASSVVKGLVS